MSPCDVKMRKLRHREGKQLIYQLGRKTGKERERERDSAVWILTSVHTSPPPKW